MRRSVQQQAEGDLTARVLRATSAQGFELGARLQALWGGYGDLWRGDLATEGGSFSVVVKDVRPPPDDGSLSHRRKLRSYCVEQAFYRRFAARTGDGCRVPKPLAVAEGQGAFVTVLEDLEANGFSGRRRVSEAEIASAVGWLAAFHASFLGQVPDDLWKVGTYWHLGTRPDELSRVRLQIPRRRLKLRGNYVRAKRAGRSPREVCAPAPRCPTS